MKRTIATALLLAFALTLARFTLSGYSSTGFSDLIIFDKVLLIVGVVSAFLFWFLMLSDFFNNHSMKHKTVWGVCLILFSWISSIVYFFKHFLPRNRSVS